MIAICSGLDFVNITMTNVICNDNEEAEVSLIITNTNKSEFSVVITNNETEVSVIMIIKS